MVRNVPQRLPEIGLQKTVAIARDEIFERIPHRFFHQLRISAIRKHQRQFLLVHQGTGWNRRQDRVALPGQLGQVRDVDLLLFFHSDQVALLELRHATARLFLDQLIRDFIVVENGEQVVPDARLIVVDVAG